MRCCSAFILAVSLGIASCGPAAQPVLPLQPDDFTLRGVPADADSNEIRLTFGAPDSMIESVNPFDTVPLITWMYDGFEVRFGEGTIPVGYMIEKRGESTPRGVTVGDPAGILLELYGEPAITQPSWTWADTVGGAGLRVIDALVEADTIRRIYIGRAVQ